MRPGPQLTPVPVGIDLKARVEKRKIGG